MEIQCYLSSICGSEDDLRKNIAQALALEKVEARVAFQRVDAEEAAQLGLSGSPSIWIDGSELQPQEAAGFT